MILYYASTENKSHCEMVIKNWTGNALTTYYSIKNRVNHIEEYYKKYWFKRYFLDSGAFGAWTRNESLDVVKYGEFLKKNKKYLTVYANLDDKNNEATTYKNLDYLESIGLNPLPVWWMHTGNWDKLKELFDKYDYIAVGWIAWEGGSKIALENNVKKLFKLAFSYWKNADGSIKKKIHWFWTTTMYFLIKYPWYSVDSTTRTNWARFGMMQIFDWKKLINIGAKDYKLMLNHFNHIPKELRDLKLLIDKSWVRNYLNRQAVWAYAFKEVEEYVTKLWKSRGIFYK